MHPPDWRAPTPADRYNLVVIGADPYPTQAEAICQVGDVYNRTRLTPFVKGLVERWLRWTR